MKNTRVTRLTDENEDYNELLPASPFDTLMEQGWITGEPYLIKSGKEATVYRCQANPYRPAEFYALKTYRARQNRNFKNDTLYQEGRVILSSRVRRAVHKKTRFGREAQAGLWQNYEFETLETLHRLGAAVPQPFAQTGGAILIEYFGDGDEPAPLLNSVALEPSQVKPLYELILGQVELWLKHNLVHGDLSPFNILYVNQSLKVIDFPQAVDPRFNPHAQMLLQRDLENVCRYFARYNLAADHQQLTGSLWRRFTRSQL